MDGLGAGQFAEVGGRWVAHGVSRRALTGSRVPGCDSFCAHGWEGSWQQPPHGTHPVEGTRSPLDGLPSTPGREGTLGSTASQWGAGRAPTAASEAWVPNEDGEGVRDRSEASWAVGRRAGPGKGGCGERRLAGVWSPTVAMRGPSRGWGRPEPVLVKISAWGPPSRPGEGSLCPLEGSRGLWGPRGCPVSPQTVAGMGGWTETPDRGRPAAALTPPSVSASASLVTVPCVCVRCLQGVQTPDLREGTPLPQDLCPRRCASLQGDPGLCLRVDGGLGI